MAALMNGPRNQFLSRAGFAQKQHGRLAGSHGFHQMQNVTESRTLSHNSFKVYLPTDFIFQIEFFLCELVFQFGYLAIGQAILDGDRQLPRGAQKEIDVFQRDRVSDPTAEGEHSKRPTTVDQGESTSRLDGFGANFSRDIGSHLLTSKIHYDRLARFEYPADQRSFDRLQRILPNESPTLRKVHSELAQMQTLRIG